MVVYSMYAVLSLRIMKIKPNRVVRPCNTTEHTNHDIFCLVMFAGLHLVCRFVLSLLATLSTNRLPIRLTIEQNRLRLLWPIGDKMMKDEYLSNEHLTFRSMQMILSCFVSPICMLVEVSFILLLYTFLREC